MHKFHLVLLFLLLGSASLAAQAIKIEASPTSFAQVMAFEEPTTAEIDTILDICLKYVFTNSDTCLLLAERALSLSEEFHQNETIHAESLLFLGDAYRTLNEWEKAEEVLLMGKAMCLQLGHETRVASADMKLGAVNIRMEQYEKALEYEFSALETFERLKDSANIYRPWFEISEIFAVLNQPLKALEYTQKALDWGEANGLPVMSMYAMNNKAGILRKISYEFDDSADTISGNPQPFRDSAHHYRLLALESYGTALPNYRRYGGKRGLAQTLSNLFSLYVDLERYDEALQLKEEIETLSEQLNDPVYMLALANNLTEVYRLKGQYAQSIAAGEQGLNNPVAGKNAMHLYRLHGQMHLTHKAAGNYREALHFKELAADFQEKNEASERNEVIATVEAKYQTAKKEKQILELNVANAAIKRKSNFYRFGAALLTLFGFLGFQLSRARRERNQKAAFSEALIDAQEDERKRIASDLHDGIGQSLLVIKRQLDANHNSTIENRAMIASTLDEVRSISRDLHPVLLEKFGITATLKDTTERIAAMAPEVFVSSEIADIDGQLTPKAEVQLYRTIQEALSNIIKHAGATAAKITVKKEAKTIDVLIQDNGKGFDYELAVARSKSLGLRTMFERITTTGGKFRIKSNLETGTEINLSLPRT